MARPDEGVTHKRGGPCRHCGKAKVSRPRGLCWKCYYAVKHLYTSQSKFASAGAKGHDEGPEPTLAELEAMIAERMKKLPAWWAAETHRFKTHEGK